MVVSKDDCTTDLVPSKIFTCLTFECMLGHVAVGSREHPQIYTFLVGMVAPSRFPRRKGANYNSLSTASHVGSSLKISLSQSHDVLLDTYKTLAKTGTVTIASICSQRNTKLSTINLSEHKTPHGQEE